MKTTILKINPARPDVQQIRQAALAVLDGKVIAFPTETVYGIGACALRKDAVGKIYEMKKRPAEKPLAYHIGEFGTLEKLNVRMTSVFRFFKKQFWPGPVTLIAWSELEEKVGIRFPKNEIACRLIRQCGELFLGTSANVSDGPSPKTAEEVLRVFPDQVDIVMDGGPCQLGEDSTVVDLTVYPPKIVRRGALIREVETACARASSGNIPRKKILIVCTGNTCRSPMAEAWLRAELRKRALADQIEVVSCGIMARDGGQAAPEANLVLKNDEVQLGDFKTRACRREEVMESDLIVAMTEQHQDFISSLCPPAAGRVIVLDVEDPIGLSIQAYEHSYQTIKQKLLQYWDQVIQ